MTASPIMTKWTIFEPGEPRFRSEGHQALAPEPSYEDLRAILDPLFDNQWWEHVWVRGGKAAQLLIGASATKWPISMFVDESGMLKQLPRNEAVSWVLYPGLIAGRAVVFHRRVWF